jgi:hypothetical protein
MPGNRVLQMMAAGKALGKMAGKLRKIVGAMGKIAEKLGVPAGSLGTAMPPMGTGAFAMGSVAGKMGTGGGPLGTDSGALGTMLHDWGSRPENDAADGCQRVWGIKFLRSGCELFARWLSRRFPTVSRSLMECEQEFLGAAGGRQVLFEQFILPGWLNGKHSRLPRF